MIYFQLMQLFFTFMLQPIQNVIKFIVLSNYKHIFNIHGYFLLLLCLMNRLKFIIRILYFLFIFKRIFVLIILRKYKHIFNILGHFLLMLFVMNRFNLIHIILYFLTIFGRTFTFLKTLSLIYHLIIFQLAYFFIQIFVHIFKFRNYFIITLFLIIQLFL
jgi:hypothetical protein